MFYCLSLSPLNFFPAESPTLKPDSVDLGSVLLRVSLACERGEERKGEKEEEFSSSHISIILYPDKKNSINFPKISKEKLGMSQVMKKSKTLKVGAKAFVTYNAS